MKYHSKDQIGPGFCLMATFKFTMDGEAIRPISRIEDVISVAHDTKQGLGSQID